MFLWLKAWIIFIPFKTFFYTILTKVLSRVAVLFKLYSLTDITSSKIAVDPANTLTHPIDNFANDS